jgi:hypothetical protein
MLIGLSGKNKEECSEVADMFNAIIEAHNNPTLFDLSHCFEFFKKTGRLVSITSEGEFINQTFFEKKSFNHFAEKLTEGFWKGMAFGEKDVDVKQFEEDVLKTVDMIDEVDSNALMFILMTRYFKAKNWIITDVNEYNRYKAVQTKNGEVIPINNHAMGGFENDDFNHSIHYGREDLESLYSQCFDILKEMKIVE